MTIAIPKEKMTADEFIAWAMNQPSGRYELAAGEVVAMAPERAAHARAKGAVFRALGDVVAAKGLQCEALPDGMAVRIDDATVYEPDAAMRCGAPPPREPPASPGRRGRTDRARPARSGRTRRCGAVPDRRPAAVGRAAGQGSARARRGSRA